MARNYSNLQNGSDIRGVALEGVEGESVTLTPEAASDLAQGFVAWLAKHTGKGACDLVVAIGRDPRLSGEAIAHAAIEAMRACGVRVLSCGIATTPAMFMSTVFSDVAADGSIMVTASHLPWRRNGLKFFSRDGGLEKSDIAQIVEIAADDSALASLGKTAGSLESCDIISKYAAHLRSLIVDGVGGGEEPLAGLKICVDAGNGSAGFYATEVLAPLGADVSASQFLEPDGHFPNHVPNPENEEAMASIMAAVKRSGCDLGLIFDTDVDRSSAVDERGSEINKNGIVAMAAALIADEYPGTTIVTDSITSNELTSYLEGTLGLKHLRYQRGYRNVINKAIELNAAGQDCQLAIETSGHAAYKSNYFLDDGSYLATLIVVRTALLAREGKKISSVIAGLTEPAESIERRLKVQAADVASAADRALATLEEWVRAHPEVSGISLEVVEPNYEGVRVALSGEVSGWFLLRKSLHDPLMPLNVETEHAGDAVRVLPIIAEALEPCTADIDTTPLH